MKIILIIFSVLMVVLLSITTIKLTSNAANTANCVEPSIFDTIFVFEEEEYIDDIPFNTYAIVKAI